MGLEHACHREVGPLDTDLDACHAEVLRQDTNSTITRHRLKEIVMRTIHDKLDAPAEDPSAVCVNVPDLPSRAACAHVAKSVKHRTKLL